MFTGAPRFGFLLAHRLHVSMATWLAFAAMWTLAGSGVSLITMVWVSMVSDINRSGLWVSQRTRVSSGIQGMSRISVVRVY